MASLISPGILLRERDITTATIVGAQALTAAFSTTFAKGEVGVITEVDSQRDLLDKFGLPVDANAEDWLVASEFLNYGGRLAVVRTDTADIRTASTTEAMVDPEYKINTQADFVGQTINELFLARTPGKWGNSAQVIVADRGADVYVEFATAPTDASQNPLAAGDRVTFSNGAAGYVLSYEASMTEWKAAIVLDEGSAEPTTTDFLQDDNLDPIASITNDAGVEAGRTPGSYLGLTADGDTRPDPATFDVVVASVDTDALIVQDVTAEATGGGTDIAEASASYVGVTGTNGTGGSATFDVVRDGSGAILSVVVATGGSGFADGDTITILAAVIGNVADITIPVTSALLVQEGGAVTVTLAGAGDGYADNETLTLLGAATGGGTDITVTVTTTVNDTAISAVYDWYTNTSVTVGELSLPLVSFGARPGTSGYAAARGIVGDELTIATVDLDGRLSGTVGNVLERVTGLSKLTDGRSAENGAVYYRDIITEQSNYLFAGTNAIATVLDAAATGDSRYIAWSQDSTTIVDAGNNRTFEVAGAQAYTLTAGADDYAYSAGEIGNAYDVFATADETEIDFILMGGSMATEDGTKSKAAKVVAIADARKDCVAFVSPHKSNQIGTGGVSLSSVDQRTNTINFFRSLPSTSYAVFDSGYKYLYDRFNDRYRYVPCNGDVAGLCVATSQVLGDWYSPAGVARGGLKNAIKLAYNPSQADRDLLYSNRINPITTLPGTVFTLFGDKTALASTSAFDRINVRRLFLNIEKRVERLASGVLFEQNDVLTRSSFSSAVNSYLSEIQARRGITDFLVVCDDTNNTPDVIDRNEFVAEILLKATRSINFISITFTATKTGVAFSEVVGR